MDDHKQLASGQTQMLFEIRHDVLGSRQAQLLCEDEFSSMDELRVCYERSEVPVLLRVNRESFPEVAAFMDDKDDVCFLSDPQDVVDLRLGKLSGDKSEDLDAVTGALNSNAMKRVMDAISWSDHADVNLTWILLEVDGLDRIRQRVGNPAADVALKSISDLVRRLVGLTEVVARHDDNSFLMITERIGQDLEEFCEFLRNQVRLGVSLKEFGYRHEVTVSLGAADGDVAANIVDVMKSAELTLAAARSTGRNCYLHYSELTRIAQDSNVELDPEEFEADLPVLSGPLREYIAKRSSDLVERLKADFERDKLTQCYSRRYLDSHLDEEMSSRDNALTLAFIDVDNLGRVNQEHGRDTGDKVLKDVCDLVSQHIRDTDWLGRYGGEEFCIVMPKTNLDAGVATLERLRRVVEETELQSSTGESLTVTLSIGAIQCVEDETRRDCLERASQLALKAKRNGCNQVCT